MHHEMESSGNMIAPFVMKTYQILSDPTTNRLIAWGRDNNSFIVLEPLDFSQRILPLYFKHSNFSSFVRQLNTYDFRKVDPDRWEFANEWFLRGQTQLLNKIVRKKHTSRTSTSFMIKHEEEEEEEEEDGDDGGGGGVGDGLVMEIAKLRHEQESLDEELESMRRRLRETERRPQQMMTFLSKVVEDPQILPQMMLNRENVRHLSYEESSKRNKTMLSSYSSSSSSSSSSGMGVSSSSGKSEEDIDGRISWRGGRLGVDYCLQSSPASSSDERFGMSLMGQGDHGYATLSSSSNAGSSGGGGGGVAALPVIIGSGGYCDSGDGVSSSYFEDLEMARQQPAPYPFSLLDGGF